MIAGIMARTDSQRGVWKAPAGLDATLGNINALQVKFTDDENGQLNPLGINSLRAFPVNGTVVWGSRTLRGADQFADEYKYIPVRRTAMFIEESFRSGAHNGLCLSPTMRLLSGPRSASISAPSCRTCSARAPSRAVRRREAYLVKCGGNETTTHKRHCIGVA